LGFFKKKGDFVKINIGVLFCVALIMPGCATRMNMAFQDDAQKLTPTSKPVFLMTATVKNTYKTYFQPKLSVVFVEKEGAKEKEDRFNFSMDEKSKNETNTLESGNNYLMRMELNPGSYEVRAILGQAYGFPLVGTYLLPVHAPFKSIGPGVFYLGHIEADVRERKDNEFKAGPAVPLIDQAITGASTGTFEVVISDQFDKDEPAFRAKFPALAGVEIKKMIVPPFDRKKAQEWWEKN
jgi:hypothetical protein